jgi:hypothetical protein
MRPRSALRSDVRARAADARFGAAALVLASCGGAAAQRPVSAPRAAWIAPVATAGTAAVRAIDIADGGVVTVLGHRGPATVGGKALALPVARGAEGVAGDVDDRRDATSVVALGGDGRARWSVTVAGQPGPVAHSGALVLAAIGGSGALDVGAAPIAVRGEPGAVIAALAAGDGAVRWTRGLGSTDWVTVASLAGLPGGDAVVGGQFAGTLRAGDHVVTSAGESDGFVARLAPTGAVRWLVRAGAASSDAVTGVAALGDDRVAIAGTFSGIADLRGTALTPVDEESAYADGFVAVLDRAGMPAWAHRLGSRGPDAVAGVAVTASGAIAVAATVRGPSLVADASGAVVAAGVSDWNGHGSADGLVAVWSRDGELRGSVLLGGGDFDGLRAIAARGDQILVAGWFAGAMNLGGAELAAAGGDDAFVAVLDDRARVATGIHATGDGREDITALAAAPSGWALGLAHTAGARLVASDGSALGEALPAPADPLGGAAIVVGRR